jgi:hypothetical protein
MKTINSVIFLSVLIFLLLVTPVIGSSDWVYYGTDSDGSVLLYKEVNIEKNGGKFKIQVWGKRVFSDKGREEYIKFMKEIGSWNEGYNKISHTMFLSELDCKKRTYRYLSSFGYDTDNKVLFSFSQDELKLNSIVPDSEMDSLRKKVCK